MSNSRRHRVRVFLFVFTTLLPGLNAARAAETPVVPLYALIVGGGPDVESNAAQIEGHVHFVAGLLPAAARRVVLFADGKTDHASVSYADPGALADAKRALAILLADNDDAEPILTRAPKLGVALDGPSRLQEFRRALGKLASQASKEPAPLLLYFAGHGTRDEKNEANTEYNLWGGDALKVRTLAAEVARLPRDVPVVLVMGAMLQRGLRRPALSRRRSERCAGRAEHRRLLLRAEGPRGGGLLLRNRPGGLPGFLLVFLRCAVRSRPFRGGGQRGGFRRGRHCQSARGVLLRAHPRSLRRHAGLHDGCFPPAFRAAVRRRDLRHPLQGSLGGWHGRAARGARCALRSTRSRRRNAGASRF